MRSAPKFLSLSALGALAVTMVPLAGAQSFGFGGIDVDTETRTEIRAELKACKEDNANDREAVKTCIDATLEANGIEKPKKTEKRPGRRVGHHFRAQIEETCGERENSTEWRTCARGARDSVRDEFRSNRPERGGLFQSSDLRAELKACLDLKDNEELRECVFGVRAEIRAGLQN